MTHTQLALFTKLDKLQYFHHVMFNQLSYSQKELQCQYHQIKGVVKLKQVWGNNKRTEIISRTFQKYHAQMAH